MSGAAPVDTRRVSGRRQVRYESYDDLVADAQRLVAIEVNTLGNWSYAQILDHIAKSIHAMIDGVGFGMPAPVRLLMRLLMKNKMVHRELPAGYKFPTTAAAKFDPPADATIEDSLAALREAVERAKVTPDRVPHPAFGRMKPGEWDKFQLRHCEMHMSFVVPA